MSTTSPAAWAFGCTMPALTPTSTARDERVRIRDLMLSAKMFTQIIIDLCG